MNHLAETLAEAPEAALDPNAVIVAKIDGSEVFCIEQWDGSPVPDDIYEDLLDLGFEPLMGVESRYIYLGEWQDGMRVLGALDVLILD